MGGPCDTAFQAGTAKEILDLGAAHVAEMKDEEHQKVLQMMNDTMKDQEAGDKWYTEFEAKFAALPED